MFSLDHVSTSSELLQSIEKLIKDSKTSNGLLKDFNSFSIATDSASTSYPFLIVNPMSETLTRQYTNGFADIIRKYQFIIRGVKPDRKSCFGLVNGLGNNVKRLFMKSRSDSTWKLTALRNQKQIVFNNTISNISFDDFVNVREGVIGQAKLTIDFNCQIATNLITPISTDSLLNTSLKELTKIIYEILTNYKSAVLPEVKTFEYGSSEPISHFPAIAVIPEGVDLESRFVGVNTQSASHSVYVFTEYQNAPKSVYMNLDIINKIRSILFANKYLFKRAYDYSMINVNFGEVLIRDKNYFTSQLILDTSSYDNI